MPIITLLVAAFYLLVIYGLLLLVGYSRKILPTRSRDAS